ncbi:MAG TPA: FISUMP domain-containing protein [Fibrobacteria bacterium]|nr:FISUMP domain-containing protein [Fibrobacteria bacterium]HOX52964.1 FISUMP domain-containing protein [Fibrobacteria bacterium]
MKPILVSLLIPLCSASAWISGTVVDLSGKPVQGAVVASSSESDISKPSGGWILGRFDGVHRTADYRPGPTSSLAFHNGRLVVSWQSHDPQGRRIPTIQPSLARPLAAQPRSAQMRPETLQVFFKGKRLVWLPLTTSDTDGVEIQIDTNWQDDHGIPWNARVRYGSLRDERDGKVYRTVRIGNHTWMAENLSYGGAVPYGGRIPGWAAQLDGYTGTLDGNGTLHDYDSIGVCYGGSDVNCQIYGRLYSWYEAVGDTTRNSAKIRHSVQGACPSGWRVPHDSDWYVFATLTNPDTADRYHELSLEDAMIAPMIPLLTFAVHNVGHDRFGFRALAGGKGTYEGTNGVHWVNSLRLGAPVQPRHSTKWSTDNLEKVGLMWAANYPGISGPGKPDPGLQIPITEVQSIAPESEPAYYGSAVADWALDALASLRCVQGD